MTPEPEKALVEKAKSDSEAFGRLFDEYYSKIFGYVLRRTGDVEIARDVVSETFLKALKNLWRFRWQGAPFSAWLYRLASNEIPNFFRQKKPVVGLDKLGDPVFSADLFEEIMLAEEKLKEHKEFLEVQKQILLLDQRYQAVISLRFFEKKQIKEIAQILGKSEGTIKSLLHRGLTKLRNQIKA